MSAHFLVLKLGLVRFATSVLVVLLANVLNRVLIVDLSVPAAQVTFCFAFQHVMTPVGLVAGYFSDAVAFRGRHRSPYLWGGMLLAMAVMPLFPGWAQALGAAAGQRGLLWQGVILFSLFGIGTTVSATAVNALLVDRLPETERGPALTLVWILTLAGFIAGSFFISLLFPTYDPQDLDRLFGLVTLAVLGVTLWGAWGVEPPSPGPPAAAAEQAGLRPSLGFLLGSRQTRVFFGFLFTSIFFFSIQTFLLTAYGGEVLSLPVAETSRFGMYMNYGIIVGMSGLHLLLSARQRSGGRLVPAVSLVLGAAAFALLSLTSFFPLTTGGLAALWLLGFSRGLYNVGLSHLTMSMAHPAFSGIFMGLWNLVSGLGLAAGEMFGGFLKDFLHHHLGDPRGAYGWVFLLEGLGLLGCLVILLPLNLDRHRRALSLFLAGTPAAVAGRLVQNGSSPHEHR